MQNSLEKFSSMKAILNPTNRIDPYMFNKLQSVVKKKNTFNKSREGNTY